MQILLLESVPTIKLNGHSVSANSKKAQALLLYLFVDRGEIYRRESLASLFWDDRTSKLSQDNLRQAFSRIRKYCKGIDDVLTIGRSDISVNRDAVKVDTEEFLKILESKETPIDPKFLKFDFLNLFSGYDDISPSFQSWMHVHQNEFERSLMSALENILNDKQALPGNRNLVADLLLKIDPTNEEAVRHKMRNYMLRGMQAEALNQYNQLYFLLDREYDVEPSLETVELNAKIKLGELESLSRAPEASAPTRTSDQSTPCVYVASFDIEQNNSLTLRMGNFFRMEVLGNLSKFREWNVVEVDPKIEEYWVPRLHEELKKSTIVEFKTS